MVLGVVPVLGGGAVLPGVNDGPVVVDIGGAIVDRSFKIPTVKTGEFQKRANGSTQRLSSALQRDYVWARNQSQCVCDPTPS